MRVGLLHTAPCSYQARTLPIPARCMSPTSACKRRYFLNTPWNYKPWISILLEFPNVLDPPSLPIAQTPVFLGSDSRIMSTGPQQHATSSPGSRFKCAAQHNWMQQVNTVSQLEQPTLSQVTTPRGRLMLRCPWLNSWELSGSIQICHLSLESSTELGNYG